MIEMNYFETTRHGRPEPYSNGTIKVNVFSIAALQEVDSYNAGMGNPNVRVSLIGGQEFYTDMPIQDIENLVDTLVPPAAKVLFGKR